MDAHEAFNGDNTNEFGDERGIDPRDFARLVPQCREFTATDMQAILAIEKRAFADDGNAWSGNDFFKAMYAGVNYICRIDEANRLAGFLGYKWNPSYFEITNLAVLPVLQKRRHGVALIDWLKSKLSHKHQTAIAVNVPESIPTAKDFFLKHGFRHLYSKHYEGRPSVSRLLFDLPEVVWSAEAAEAAKEIPKDLSLQAGF